MSPPTKKQIDAAIEGVPVPPKGPKRNALFDACMPIFDAERGNRLRYMRMKLLLDQRELAEKLGISASTLSDIEKGKLAVSRIPFTLSQFMDIFGDLTSHILLGTGMERHSYGYIAQKFQDHHMKHTRKPGSGQWRAHKYTYRKPDDDKPA